MKGERVSNRKMIYVCMTWILVWSLFLFFITSSRLKSILGVGGGVEGMWKVGLGTYNCWFCKTNEENKTVALCADLAGTSLSAVKSDSSTRTSDIFEGWI